MVLGGEGRVIWISFFHFPHKGLPVIGWLCMPHAREHIFLVLGKLCVLWFSCHGNPILGLVVNDLWMKRRDRTGNALTIKSISVYERASLSLLNNLANYDYSDRCYYWAEYFHKKADCSDLWLYDLLSNQTFHTCVCVCPFFIYIIRSCAIGPAYCLSHWANIAKTAICLRDVECWSP